MPPLLFVICAVCLMIGVAHSPAAKKNRAVKSALDTAEKQQAVEKEIIKE